MSLFQSVLPAFNGYNCSWKRKRHKPHEFLCLDKKCGNETFFAGFHCIHCDQEMLVKEFHPDPDEACACVTWEHDSETYRLLELKHNYEVRTAFQIEPNKTLIKSREKVEEHLKPGDLIAFHRNYKPMKEMYWHVEVVKRAIGVKVKLVEVVDQNGKEEILPGVRENEIDFTKPGHENMYRLNFDEDTRKNNPTWLVLSRARAALRARSAHSKIRFQKYNVISNNCEMFAYYCKLGVQKSRQVRYGARKVAEAIFGDSMACVGQAVTVGVSKTICPSVLKAAKIGTAANVLATATVIVLDGASCMKDVIDLVNERQCGNLEWKEFAPAVAKRVIETGVEASCCAGPLILGGLISMIPGIGQAPLLATAALGIPGGIGGKFGGNRAGRLVAKNMAARIKHEEVIRGLHQLQQGDHVVIGSIHRHHVIVLEIKCSDTNAITTTTTVAAATRNTTTIPQGRLRVIHRRHNRGGVREEWLDVGLSVIYRVLWPEEERRPTQEIIQRAKARVGEKIYDVHINKCERFAVECIQATY